MGIRRIERIALGAVALAMSGAAQARPNVVLMFPDNLGWGEVGVYGSVRGVPTPRTDEMAAGGSG